MDHYATLGVSPEAPPATIRAAYLELMRRYHPDRNNSAAAAAQTRAITAAYAVLGTPERRATYDLQRQRGTLLQLVCPPTSSESPPTVRWKSAWLPPVVGIAAVLVLVPLLFDPPAIPVPEPTFIGGAEEQELSAQHEQRLQAAAAQTAHCSSPAVTNVVTRALFGRALRLRPDDPAQVASLLTYARILTAGAAPTAGIPAAGEVRCEAVVAVDLPASLVTAEGSQTIEGTMGYALKPAGGGAGGMVRLTSVGSFPAILSTIKPRASLANTSTVQTPAVRAMEEPVAPIASSPGQRKAAPQPRPVRQALQNPSFSCQSARSQGAQLVCNSAFLASLDRELARVYGGAVAANPAAVPHLRRSDSRFLARRDACSSEACVVSAYFAAIKELQDISAVSGR